MQELKFRDRSAASAAAAERIAAALERRLEAQGEASLVVSGGTTPVACYEALAKSELDWAGVRIVLSDERWVPPDDEASNEKLVRDVLLRERAADAELVGVYRDGVTPAARAAEIDVALRHGPFPFACALLGMGTDGHFASLFPDADALDEGLDPESRTLCLPVTTAASPHPRVSLSLSALARSDEVLLLIFGEQKWHTLEQAKSAPDALPVSRLLTQKRAPVSVYWAP